MYNDPVGRLLSLLFLALAIGGTSASAQPPMRRATTIEAIRAYPGFFHSQAVVVAGTLALTDGRASLQTEGGALWLAARQVPAEGPAEVTGVMYDVGRMNSDDPRIVALGIGAQLAEAYGDRWPRPGEELVLMTTDARDAEPPTGTTSPPVRALALWPERYVGERVTVSGQFRGRNLYADLPDAPPGERTDFVLRAGEGAVWITGLRPRGDGFNFDTTRKVDTGRWIRVTGTVRHGRGLVWLEGASLTLAAPPTEGVAEVRVPAPPPPPLEVIFSSPTGGEIDVATGGVIRLQFSRDVDAASLEQGIRLSYVPAEGGEPVSSGEGTAIPFKATYTGATRAVEIRPAQPIEPFRRVALELLGNIRGPDGATLKPFVLTFSTGGG